MVVAIFVVAVTVAAAGFDLASSVDSRPATLFYGGPFVAVDGTLVAYRERGTAGSPVVLLGGAAEPSWVWHRVGPLLAAAHHRVGALDLPPFGYTQRHGPYTMAGGLSPLDGFEARLGIQRPLVVGHSLGAGVAVADALPDPHGVSDVVLLDGDALSFAGPGFMATLLAHAASRRRIDNRSNRKVGPGGFLHVSGGRQHPASPATDAWSSQASASPTRQRVSCLLRLCSWFHRPLCQRRRRPASRLPVRRHERLYDRSSSPPQ